jgi:hypothetical protein
MSISKRSPLPPPVITDWWRILAMGVLLAGLVFVTFFYDPSGQDQLGTGPPIVRAQVAVPEIDQQLLRSIDDGTRTERLVLEPAPLAHLLEKSIDVVPSVADALGMPREPVPVAMLRASPSTYRGAYLWYSGELKFLAPGKSGHPVAGYRIHEGYLETVDGETVMFRVSLEPKVQVGEFVRIEGFFMKLRDSAAQPKAEMAPVLVGPELFPDYPRWDPVETLDPNVFEDLRDGVFADGEWVDYQDAEHDLERSQDVPLWTLASFALHRDGGAEDTLAHWRQSPAFVSKEQLDAVKHGQVPAGTPFRLLGTFQFGEWTSARPNPVGIEHWTQVWIQIRDLGGKIVPVWVPKKLSDLKRNESLEVRAYYLRRFVYDLQNSEGKAFTPLFVAADLDRFTSGPEHPLATSVKWAFAALVMFVIVLLFTVARRDRRARDEHEVAMIERRRRRRNRGHSESGQHAGT